MFSIASSGALSPIAGSPFPAICCPDGIKVSPDGKFLAVAELIEFGPNQIEMFRIASNGSLTSLGAFPGGGFGNLAGVDINCATSLLYGGEANVGNTIVDGYSIASNGALTPVPGSPFVPGVGNDSNVVLLSPNDKSLFVSNQLSNTITVFSVASNGALTQVAGSPFPTGVVVSLTAYPPKACFLTFSSFRGKLELDLDDGSFDLNARFSLGPGGSINPPTEPVTLTIGTYSVTIPPGSFVQNKHGYSFEGVTGGVSLEVLIKFGSTAGRYRFLAEGRGANLKGTTNPVTVTISIGNNTGTTQINAKSNEGEDDADGDN